MTTGFDMSPGSDDDNQRNDLKKFFERGAKQVSDKDVERVVRRADDIDARFRSGGPLGRFLQDGRLLISLVRDYWSGSYRRIPYWSIAAIVFTLLYIFNPLDILPDALPILGQIDDVAILSMCLLMVERDLRSYRKGRTEGEPDS